MKGFLTEDERKLIGDIRTEGFTLGFRYVENFAAAATWLQPPVAASPFILPFPCLLKNFWISGLVGANGGIPARVIPSEKMMLFLGDGQPPETNPGFDSPNRFGALAANWTAITTLHINAHFSGLDVSEMGLIYTRLWLVFTAEFGVSIGEAADINIILRLERA